MENIVLTIHLLLALALIGVVLMQRSEGGIGMGGGGGGGAMSGRAAASALTKLTWILAIGFLITSLTLTVLSATSTTGDSVVNISDAPAGEQAAPAALDLPLAPLGTDAPAAPPVSE